MKLKYKLLGMLCFGVLLSNNPVFASVGDDVNSHVELASVEDDVNSHAEFARRLKERATRENNISSYDNSEVYIIEKERYYGPSRDIEYRSIIEDIPEGFSILDHFSMHELSELAGVSIEEMLELQDHDILDFDISMVGLIEARNFGTWDESRPRVGIRNIRDRVLPGDIHLTPQGRHYGFQHGHAALAFDEEFNIEILGTGHVSDKISNLGWGDYNSYRMYWTPELRQALRKEVAIYADNNLKGRPYVALAYVDSRNHVNCATLVWKAFHDSGYLTMTASTLAYYLPANLAYARETEFIYSYNWNL